MCRTTIATLGAWTALACAVLMGCSSLGADDFGGNGSGRSYAPSGPDEAPTSGPRSRPPGEFRIGNAVAPIHYYMTAWTVTDMFKMAGFEEEIGNTDPSRAWTPVIEGRWAMDRRADVPTDEVGWATSLDLRGGGTADALTTIVAGPEDPTVFPNGTYRVLWEGEGSISIDGYETTEVVDGEMTFEYDGTRGILLSIIETDPNDNGNYIRNIQVLRPDAEAGARFHARYLDDIRPYAVIRPLHFHGDQLTYGPRLAWEDRKPEEYSHWGGALGAPYEVSIDLANQSESDLWLNVPVAAADSFMRGLARLVAAELYSDRRLYIELGNELWNFSDPYELGRNYAHEQARTRWPGVEGTVTDYSDGDPVSRNMMIYSWQGSRTAEMAEIFRSAFSDPKRVVVVLAGQMGASVPFYHPSRLLLESPIWVAEEGAEPAATHADAFAVAPYVQEEEGVIEFPRTSPEAFIAEAIRYIRGEGRWTADGDEPGLRYAIRSDAVLAEKFELPLIAYEGGQHFTGSSYTRDIISTHPDMYELYLALFEVWETEGGGLFVHYAGIIPRGVNEPGTEPGYFESENFGIKERQTETEADAPKWRALRDQMRELGQF